jgi:hypothetical protein
MSLQFMHEDYERLFVENVRATEVKHGSSASRLKNSRAPSFGRQYILKDARSKRDLAHKMMSCQIILAVSHEDFWTQSARGR